MLHPSHTINNQTNYHWAPSLPLSYNLLPWILLESILSCSVSMLRSECLLSVSVFLKITTLLRWEATAENGKSYTFSSTAAVFSLSQAESFSEIGSARALSYKFQAYCSLWRQSWLTVRAETGVRSVRYIYESRHYGVSLRSNTMGSILPRALCGHS